MPYNKFMRHGICRHPRQSIHLMPRTDSILRIASLIAGITLLTGISIEVLTGNHRTYSAWYMHLQLAACLVFMADFAGGIIADYEGHRRFAPKIVFLLLSIPYLNILQWSGACIYRSAEVAVASLPLIRSFVAMGVVIRWLIGPSVRRLLTAYVFTVVCFTYLAALIFYDYEITVNNSLDSFGDALWWAWMNVTTVGAAIFPVTAIGKMLSVMLPCLGMMFFPIFTLYVTDIYNNLRGNAE